MIFSVLQHDEQISKENEDDVYQGTCEGQAAQLITRKDIQCFQFKYLTPRLCLSGDTTPKYCLLFKV